MPDTLRVDEDPDTVDAEGEFMAEEVPVIFIEGLASVGLVERYWVEECAGGKRVRIHVKTRDGRHLHTKCIDRRGSKRVIHVLAEYIKLSRLIVEE